MNTFHYRTNESNIYDTSTFTHTQGAVEEMKGESQVSDLKVPVCGVGRGGLGVGLGLNNLRVRTD